MVPISERDDLCFTPAVELRDLTGSGSLSVVELVESVLDRIEEVNRPVNAYVSLRPEEALNEARAADGATEPGPLHGIPFSVKDLIETADLPTTYASRPFVGFQAGFDVLAVTKLKAAGAILVGKTNASEFGMRSTTENILFGATSTPWNLTYNSGGSSGGAAAACAAGISPLALGNDGGGSNRMPSHCCATVGMKPSRGRVTLGPGGWEAWFGLITHGPIARTVRDAALMLDVIAGPVLGDPYGIAPATGSFLEACDRRPTGLRIGYQPNPPDGAPLDPEVRVAYEHALQALESLGFEVFESDVDLGDLRRAYMVIKECSIAAMVTGAGGAGSSIGRSVADESLRELESNTLAIMRRGLSRSGPELAATIDYVRGRAAKIMAHWDGMDFLATPTLTKLPLLNGLVPSIEDYDERWNFCLDWHVNTLPFNMTGQPAISVPAGWTELDLPVGLQLVGRPGDDAGLLSLAAAYEEARPWRSRRPKIEEGARTHASPLPHV